jgi:hypothetical protein
MHGSNRSSNNQRKLDQLTEAMDKALDEALQKGFFGNVTAEVSIQDGSIQFTVCRVERMQK